MTTVYTQVLSNTTTLLLTKITNPPRTNTPILGLTFFWYKSPFTRVRTLNVTFVFPSQIIFYIDKARFSLSLRPLQIFRCNLNPTYNQALRMFLMTSSKKSTLQLWFLLSSIYWPKFLSPFWNTISSSSADVRPHKPLLSNFRHL